jgi:hypothetical protein
MQECIEFRFPEFSGCYALLRAGKCVYVGQSESVFSRVTFHRNTLRRFRAKKHLKDFEKVIEFDVVRIYPCPVAQLDKVENELILQFNPELNIVRPKETSRKVDIEALVAKAGIDAEEWRKMTTNAYSPRLSRGLRRP